MWYPVLLYLWLVVYSSATIWVSLYQYSSRHTQGSEIITNGIIPGGYFLSRGHLSDRTLVNVSVAT